MTGMDAAFIDRIEAEDAWNLMAHDDGVALVDVRTIFERDTHGHPDLTDLNRTLWHIEWRCDRLSAIKAYFVLQLEDTLAITPATHLIFYCGDGRSAMKAAQIVAGVFADNGQQINVSCIHSALNHSDCWRAASLPWRTLQT